MSYNQPVYVYWELSMKPIHTSTHAISRRDVLRVGFHHIPRTRKPLSYPPGWTSIHLDS